MDKKTIDEAYAIANNAIYFDDRSDYKNALYDVCLKLKPEALAEEIGKEYLEEGGN